jgi:hypothetical protein
MKRWAEWILQASPELERREAASIWYTGGQGAVEGLEWPAAI